MRHDVQTIEKNPILMSLTKPEWDFLFTSNLFLRIALIFSFSLDYINITIHDTNLKMVLYIVTKKDILNNVNYKKKGVRI